MMTGLIKKADRGCKKAGTISGFFSFGEVFYTFRYNT
tara:strand:+ start:23 stop:133 length:111 start_codon:yes stop_codon:yes gene_type:complete